jgi:hypothetical protein
MGLTTSTTNAGLTYVPLGTYTLGTATQNVTFNSISGYTDLYLVVSNVKNNYAGSSSINDTFLTFNGDSGSNYSYTELYGNGSSIYAGGQQNAVSIKAYYPMASATAAATITAHIFNYSNSSIYKSVLVKDAGTVGLGLATRGALWRNTAAITSVTVGTSSSYKMSAGTTITLFGIKAA